MISLNQIFPRRLVEARTVPRLLPSELHERLPILVTAGLGAGLVMLLALSPTDSGDYGQWLMTSRFYMGGATPDYRNLLALPPLVPIVLAGIRFVVGDPVVALHVLNMLLIGGLVATFYLLGAVLLQDRWAGALSAIAGLFVTDRFLELFAFGGLLQAASTIFLGLSVVAFCRAAQDARLARRWWILGAVAVGLAALSHAATGLLAVPIALSVAGVAAFRHRTAGVRRLAAAVMPLGLTLAAVAAYWGLVLIPANTEYVTNPAALAYRGPDRLFSPLFGQWPTAAIVALGTVALVLGAIRSLARRRPDGFLVLVLWITVPWGAMLASMLSGTGTDYPRFATPLLAPVAVAAAAAAGWLLGRLSEFLCGVGLAWPSGAVVTAVVATGLIVTAPLVVARFEDQAQYYELRDAEGLAAAAVWIDAALAADPTATVLTEVREGKWVEGLTGREALFSQPVRYAFRRVEWQRSVDADALLKSTTSLTSGFIGGQFTGTSARAGRTAPTGLTIRANHGGEFVDLLRLTGADTTLISSAGRLRAAQLAPMRTTRQVDSRAAAMTGVWVLPGDASHSLTQSITVWQDGATMRITLAAAADRVQTVLRPVAGVSITSFERDGSESTVCFTRFGDSEPCLRIWTSEAKGVQETRDGAVRITAAGRGRIDVLVTALTAGEASVGLSLLQPAQVADEYHIGAALLYEPDPAYAERARRLAAIGFTEVRAFGPYRVLLRERSDTP